MSSTIHIKLLSRFINSNVLRNFSSNIQFRRSNKTQINRPFPNRLSKFDYLGKANENSYLYSYICTRLKRYTDSSFISESEKEINMSHNQFLESLFQVILKRDKSDVLLKHEWQILQILEKPEIGDIAIICLAYFKTQEQISNRKVLRKVLQETIKLIPKINFKQPGFCAIIKSVRYTRDLEVRDLVIELIDALMKISDIQAIFDNPFNAVHILKLTETYRVHDDKLLNLVYSTMFSDLTAYRIKDIQYVITSLSNFQFKDPCDNLKKNLDQLCEVIVSETRYDEHLQYPHLLPLLRAFLMFDYQNDKIISYINTKLDSSEFSKQILTTLEGDKTALLLYVATRMLQVEKVFMPQDSLAQRLSTGILRESGNVGSVKADSSISHLDFILNNKKGKHLVISNLYRKIAISLAKHPSLQSSSYRLHFQFTTPHQNFADLIISKDSEAPGHFDSKTLMPQEVPSDQRHCLLMALRDFDFVDGQDLLSGYKTMMTKILKRLGYQVVYVNIDKYHVDRLAEEVVNSLNKDSFD